MSNIIQDELESAKQLFNFDYYNGVKELCRNNVVIVETMILNDSRYANIYGDKSDTRSKIEKLRICIDLDTLKSIIEDINKQNSTHTSKREIGVLAERIVKYNQNRKNKGLINFLCEPDKEFSLIKELSKKIKVNKRERSNFSLAAKICQTLCFVINEGNGYQDNFMKFDNVLKSNLPKYLRAYNISIEQILNNEKKEIITFNEYKRNKKDGDEEILLNWLYKEQKYPIYLKMIKLLIEASGNKISKNGLDHLIWYTNK